jgi:hypothetical protein
MAPRVSRSHGVCTDNPPEERIVLLKAWNEWAAGNHIEPDQEWGRAWLVVIREEL